MPEQKISPESTKTREPMEGGEVRNKPSDTRHHRDWDDDYNHDDFYERSDHHEQERRIPKPSQQRNYQQSHYRAPAGTSRQEYSARRDEREFANTSETKITSLKAYKLK
jgi:hypothetical protein